MKIWKYTPKDIIMPLFEMGQFAVMLFLAARWEHASLLARSGGCALLICMATYNIIVITHLFTHTPWFHSKLMNSLASMLNSINIGQSAEAYKLTHVRNHHRYNNDEQDEEGNTQDLSSTFREGVGGEHATLGRYAFLGAAESLVSIGRALMSVTRLWRVSGQEHELWDLASKSAEKRVRELRQIRLDRMAQFLAVGLLLVVSWKWTLFCYLPSFYIVLALVNLQNYYEHYGAMPDSRYTDSVSYYGRLYNLLTFNDGYHQEHHLRPQAHWTTMPAIHRDHSDKLDHVERIVSPVPAILGFLHRNRPLLHHTPIPEAEPNRKDEERALSATEAKC